MESEAPTASSGAESASPSSSPSPSSVNDSPVSTPTSSNPAQQDGQEAQEGQTSAEGETPLAKEVKQKFKFKDLEINGQKVEREFDEDQMRVQIQKSLAAEQRFREAAEMRKQVEQFKTALRDPTQFSEILQHLGANPQELAEQILWPQIQQEMLQRQLAEMPPEQRAHVEQQMKLQQREQELQAREAKLQEFETQRKQAAEQQAIEHHKNEYATQMMNAIQKAGFDQSIAPQAVQRMAQLAMDNLEYGLDLPFDVLAETVKEQMAEEKRALLPKNLTPELAIKQFSEWYGPEVVQMIIRGSLSQPQSVPSPTNPVTSQKPTNSQPQPGQNEPRSPEEWREYMRKLERGLL